MDAPSVTLSRATSPVATGEAQGNGNEMGYVLLALSIHMLRPPHSDLRDACAIHAQNFKGVVVPCAGLADLRDAADLGGDEAAEGVEVVVIFVRQLVDVELLFEFVDWKESVKDPALRFFRACARAGGGVAVRTANDLLHNVVHCDESNDAAILIEDNCFVDCTRAELLQNTQSFHGARDEERLSDVVLKIDFRAVQRRIKKLLRVDDTTEIIEILIGDRENIVGRSADDAQLLTFWLCKINPCNLCALS